MPGHRARRPDPRQQWLADGLALGERERSTRSLMWEIGDWWNRGEPFGDRAEIVKAADWKGPTHGTCRVAGSVAKRWGPLSRINALDFKHHQVVASLDDDKATAALQWCLQSEEPRPVSDLKTYLKQQKRAEQEAEFAEATREASRQVGSKLYGVIYADPPWRFEPYSRETGLDRAADNHYPTMLVDDICALQVPAADNCVLFLWATVPMLPEALRVMTAWGFVYRSHFVWVKDKPGTGYWNRNRHEILLTGIRGSVPAPAPGEQYDSVIEAKVAEHSAKPSQFAEMIEDLFRNTPMIELFARKPRLGWDVWGNEVPPLAAD